MNDLDHYYFRYYSAATMEHSDDATQALDSILKNARDSLLPDELSYLITAFLPTQPTDHRSKAYLVLSSFCQGVRSSSRPPTKDDPDPATKSLVNIFSPVLSRLQETNEDEIFVGASFLTALFQVDWQTASSLLLQDGLIEVIADIHDLFPSPRLSLEVAHLLGQASGYKPCRAVLSGSSQSIEWLKSKSKQSGDTALRAAAAIALVKLSRGTAADAIGSTNPQEQVDLEQDEELAQLMKRIVISGDDQSSLGDAVEGLAYLCVDPVIKEVLSNDSSFLMALFSLVPRRKYIYQSPPKDINSTLFYGILVIITNLVAYQPRLNEEDAQIEKLRRMAKANQDPSSAGRNEELAILEDDEHARQRCRRLIIAGALDALAVISATESRGVRSNAGKAFLSFVEDKDNRGKILQSGGGKALMNLIRHALASLPSSNSKSSSNTNALLEATDLNAIQALAKLAITAAPVQVFGPNDGAVYDAIRPLTLMLLHPSANLLQRFEAIMALTNLSSLGPQVASRIAKADGLMNKVELLMLEQHTMIRRAAVELICNLIAGSDEVFEKYGGAKSKMQILLALSDVEDLPTQLAASGALATLTSAPNACRALEDLQRERKRVMPILAQLIDPSVGDDDDEPEGFQTDPGLAHRGIVCACNFLLSIKDPQEQKRLADEAISAGLVLALSKTIQGQSGDVNPAVATPTAEILKWIMEAQKI